MSVPSNGASGPPEVIQVGPSGPPSRRRWAALVVGVVLIGSGVGWAVARDGSAESDVTPPPTPTRSAQPAGVSDRITTVTIPMGRNLLGVTADWELLGRGPDELVRIEPAAGRITRTPVPGLRSSGPVSFIVGPHRSVVRPLDFVPGYQVVDGELPRSLPPALRHGGLILPGPRTGTVWVPSSRGSVLRLVRIAGGPTDTLIRLPVNAWSATADGGGYALVSKASAVWRARPGELTRISDGTLLATGPTGWLLRECGRDRCANVVVDRRRGNRRVLPGPAWQADNNMVGAVAPDGSAAAVFDGNAGSAAAVTLLDLRTGARRRVPVAAHIAPLGNTVVWSPDSRWLFVVDPDRRLWVVNAATGKMNRLAVPLPSIEQLAVRTR